jgi:NTE family protein
VDIQEGVPVVFDSYEKEDGTRKSGYGRYGELGFDAQIEDQSSSNKWDFEHVIRYEDGIKSDFVLASCTVPVNYDYTRLNVENPKLATGGLNHESKMDKVESDRSSSSLSSSYSNNNNSNLRFFWDGGLLANTPLRETIIAHRYYWSKVRKMHYDMPPLSIGIINLHPKNKNIFLMTMTAL